VSIPLTEYEENDWKLELSKHDEQLSSKQEEEAIPCFSKTDFIKRIGQGEDWHKLLQANIYLEFVALRLLERELTSPGEIQLNRMSFSSRIDLISAMGLIPKDIICAVKIVSKKRNKVAHELAFELHKQDIQQIASSIPKYLKDIAREINDFEEDEPLLLRHYLSIIVLMFEQFRLERVKYLVWVEHKKKREMLVQKMIKQVLEKIST
jgi:hypothetical protein